MRRIVCLLMLVCAVAGAQTFTATGSLNTARAGAAAVRLLSGQVLIVGGVPGVKGAALASAELYDPAAGTFAATGSLSAAITDPQAVLMASGKVLVIGADATATAIYDPAAGRFSDGPALPVALDDPHAVLLSDGDVWITGLTQGCSAPNCISPVDIYHPASDQSTSGQVAAAGQLQLARQRESVVALPGAKVLVFQGWSANASGASSPMSSVEICDASGACAAAATPVGEAVSDAGAVLLNSGQVLICGGDSHAGNATTACGLYDPRAQNWTTTTGPMAAARFSPLLVNLQDGTVLVAGSRSGPGPDAEIYNSKLGTFTSSGNFLSVRTTFTPSPTATLLTNGHVLIAGGVGSSDGTMALSDAALFTPAAPAPDFSIAADPARVTVSTATTATFTLTAQGANGFSDAIALSCSGNGAYTCAFDPVSIKPGGSSTLTLSGIDLTGPSSIAFQVLGTSEALSHTLDLRVFVQPPLAVLSVKALSFGSQNLQTTSPGQTLTLDNGGASTLHIAGIATSGDFAESDGCPATIGNGGSACTIKVTFTPTATGSRTGTLTITDDAPFSPQAVALTGTGVAAPAPAVSLSPSSLSFGNETAGATSPAQTVTLTNSGDAALNVQSVAASGDFAATSPCGSIAPGQTCTISVTFAPPASGDYVGALSITDNASGSPQTVALTGTGQNAAAPAAPAAPSGGASLQPAPGSAPSATVNPGKAATYTLSLASTGGFSGAVSLSCSGAPAGSTCMVTPTSATLGRTPVPVNVTVTTTAASSAWPPLGGSIPLWPWAAVLGIAALLMLRPRRRWVLITGLELLLALGLAACGGTAATASKASTNSPESATPSGAYTLTVTASAHSATVGSTQLTLSVE